MGAHRSEGGRDWLVPDGPEQTEQSPPWNLMIKHRQIHRRGRRSHMAVSYTDPQVSMDLLRAVLQPSFNEDIMAVFRKYQKFFEKAAENVKENVGDDVQTDQLIRETCRNVLEHVRPNICSRRRRSTGRGQRSQLRGPDLQPTKTTAREEARSPRRARPGVVAASDRPHTFSTQVKLKSDPIKREGPKWDPSRLNESSTFVLGSRANKALGMGGTRGRIYIKHADLFKYAADAKDKQWLAERHHMRATGGKMAYLLIEEDIQDLSRSDEYNCVCVQGLCGRQDGRVEAVLSSSVDSGEDAESHGGSERRRTLTPPSHTHTVIMFLFMLFLEK
ncbi:deoxynucleotidyltransferase terminal-interacting protein 1 isoform X3 [Pseudoliparis swirei]|uniref:deoxynucleotidyltransferase terminal-interacting protein 1 isoform X3 n=1 Tax=Pseudoliparis swirei TaxID=2059687 RepID=UPI0024BDB185|nr:deoxynucleotidyltransferase terminal-interacting protein 1 isoform X3 [Pseudoliparis swirei]